VQRNVELQPGRAVNGGGSVGRSGREKRQYGHRRYPFRAVGVKWRQDEAEETMKKREVDTREVRK
jgi:hypothetical protein